MAIVTCTSVWCQIKKAPEIVYLRGPRNLIGPQTTVFSTYSINQQSIQDLQYNKHDVHKIGQPGSLGLNLALVQTPSLRLKVGHGKSRTVWMG